MRRTSLLRSDVAVSLLLTPLLVLLGAAPSTANAGTIRTVALSDGPAPGTETAFESFGTVSLNSAGQTVFLSRLCIDVVICGGFVGREYFGYWSEGGGAGLDLVVRGGTAPPGTESGFVFGILARAPVFNSAGQAAFAATLDPVPPGPDFGNRKGIWSEGGGAGLALVARTGDPAPGMGSGVTFAALSTAPRLNDAGQTAFKAFIAGPGIDGANDAGIWSEGGGAGLARVVSEGDPAPGTEADTIFQGILDPVLNGAGEIAFNAFLAGPGLVFNNQSGIWSGLGGDAGLTLVAREGDRPPGTESGVAFGRFSRTPALNDAGETAFQARLKPFPQVDSSNDTGIWSEGGGAGLALVAREGDPAPGTESGVNFGGPAGLGFDPVLNGAGQTSFRAFIGGPGVDATNDLGIWSEGAGAGLALVAREGDPAPGAESCTVGFAGFFDPSMNGTGQTAFKASVSGPGVDGTNDLGIWAEDASFDLRLVAREGDQFDVDDGPGTDLRTITALDFVRASGGEEGGKSAFNDRGQLAFVAHFSGSGRPQGVFVYEPDPNDPPPDNSVEACFPGADPSISITSPADGAVLDADEILVEGVATDDGEVVSVVVSGVPAELVSTENPDDPAEVFFSALVPLNPGENEIVAIVTDDGGNTTEASILIENEPAPQPLVCDTNGDGSVDLVDISAIFAARGSVATGPDDPRDINGDGLISVNDGRLCVLQCTNPRCAPSAP